MTSWKIVKNWLSFSSDRTAFSIVVLVVASIFLYLGIGKDPVWEKILDLSAIPIVALAAYLIARTYAPVQLKKQYVNEIDSLRKEVLQLTVDASPKLIITGGETEHPFFYSEYSFSEHGNVKICRVKVENSSNTTVLKNVHVQLEVIDPLPFNDLPCAPFLLKPMNSAVPSTGMIDLHPTKHHFFDVVSLCDSDNWYDYLKIEHIVSGANQHIHHERGELKFIVILKAYSDETFSERQEFYLGWHENEPYLVRKEM